MFGDLQKKQEEIKEKLAAIEVSADAGDGMIKVTVNGNRELVDVSISSEFQYEDKEELEDLILVAVNKALGLATAKEQEESQRLINDMLPPGMGDIFGS